MRTEIIEDSVTHQGIGGKEFLVEMEVPVADVIFKAYGGNWACYNYLERRPDVNMDFPHKIYYGKVGILGYVVSEDEFKQKQEKE